MNVNVYSTDKMTGQVPVVQGAYVQPYPQPIGQPIVGVASPVVVNQVVPVSVMAHTSSSYVTICPTCKNMVSTTAIKQFNCCTCLLCYCTGIFWFLCIQMCRGKDFCCYDATHNCPVCGNLISTYESC